MRRLIKYFLNTKAQRHDDAIEKVNMAKLISPKAKYRKANIAVGKISRSKYREAIIAAGKISRSKYRRRH